MSQPAVQPAPSDQSDPDRRWAALAILAVAVLLSMTTWFSASAVVPQLRAEWGLAAGQAGLLILSVQLGYRRDPAGSPGHRKEAARRRGPCRTKRHRDR